MARAKPPRAVSDKVRKALASIGVDEETVRSLTSSKAFERIVVPVYWKDGMVTHVQRLSIQRLPEFLSGFEEEFPDGQVRWDDDYDSEDVSSGDVAIRVYFNYQEDDEGDHWSPPPTLLEEESYDKLLSKAAFKGQNPILAGRILREK